MEPFSVVIVTRGDVDLEPVVEPYSSFDHTLHIYDNSLERDLKVYGRFVGVKMAKHKTIMFQDDDVILPEITIRSLLARYDIEKKLGNEVMVANDAHGENPGGLEDVALTAAGAVVSKTLIAKTWAKWNVWCDCTLPNLPAAPDGYIGTLYECDFLFGLICPHVTLNLPYTNRWPNHGNRLCDQPWQEPLKRAYVKLGRQVRDW